MTGKIINKKCRSALLRQVESKQGAKKAANLNCYSVEQLTFTDLEILGDILK